MQDVVDYVPLYVKSNHSFLEGASHPEELVERAHGFGLSALALVDRDGVYGAVKAHAKAKELGIKLLVGAEVTLKVHLDSDLAHSVVMLAKNRSGYAALCRLISTGRQRAEKGCSLVTLDEVCGAAGDVIVLCSVPQLLPSLSTAFRGALYALCLRHLMADDLERERVLCARASELGIEIVGATEVLYHDAQRRPLADVLACIRHGCTLSDAGIRIAANAEHDLKSQASMRERFADRPELLATTLRIADQCQFNYDELRYRYPRYLVSNTPSAAALPDGGGSVRHQTPETLPHGKSEGNHLRDLTLEGAHRRYPEGIPPEVHLQLERELALIAELDYGGYFLTMYEIVQFCSRSGILCQGRGSAANSAVCFCLGITAVDPVRMELLFERFLSRERAEPPDIDLDIEHGRREEVIQWVYQRYGRRHAAMVANLIRYRARSAVRDVGKVLGIPATELDGIARLLSHYSDSITPGALVEAGLDPRRPVLQQLLALCAEIQDFPRHLSVHPGGFLLGHEPVDSIVPIEPAAMEGRTVIQWDKYDIETLGLFKVDLLGLGALTAVHRCLELLSRHKGIELDMASIPAEDHETYAMIARADTVGVFQIESRAQMAMLPRLAPATFYDLVIEVAIVRPGPIQGDMVHPYLRRRTGEEAVTYPHPSLERVLGRTLGIPIFQEQVMKLAVAAAGYTPGEADQLRRDMAAWRSSGRIEAHHERLVQRMVERGIPSEFAERVFSQIRGFGEYGFPESHAASFALLAYVTAWLKCHHPEVFVCAMLNAQPMGFYAASTLIEDAGRHGVITLPIDVNHSEWDCTLETTEVANGNQTGFYRVWAVRMGLRYVKGLGTRERERLVGLVRPVRSVEDFARATRLPLKALLVLAEAGAFDSLGMTRREALWRARAAVPGARDTLCIESDARAPAWQTLTVPEQVLWDYRTSEHSARGHPMAPLRPWLEQRGLRGSSDVRELAHGTAVECMGLVICRQRPGSASGVVFLTLEDEQGFINLVVWTHVFERYQRIVRTASLLGVRGKVQTAEGVVHVIAEELYVPTLRAGPEGHRARDFH